MSSYYSSTSGRSSATRSSRATGHGSSALSKEWHRTRGETSSTGNDADYSVVRGGSESGSFGTSGLVSITASDTICMPRYPDEPAVFVQPERSRRNCWSPIPKGRAAAPSDLRRQAVTRSHARANSSSVMRRPSLSDYEDRSPSSFCRNPGDIPGATEMTMAYAHDKVQRELYDADCARYEMQTRYGSARSSVRSSRRSELPAPSESGYNGGSEASYYGSSRSHYDRPISPGSSVSQSSGASQRASSDRESRGDRKLLEWRDDVASNSGSHRSSASRRSHRG